MIGIIAAVRAGLTPMNSVSAPRLRLQRNSPHNSSRLGTTPAIVGLYEQRPHVIDRACMRAWLDAWERAAVDFLSHFLFGVYSEHFQDTGVPTSYREVAQWMSEQADTEVTHQDVGVLFGELLRRRIILRKAEDHTDWRGPQAYRYTLAHPSVWDSEGLSREVETDGGVEPVWEGWRDRVGDELPTLRFKRGQRDKLPVLPVEYAPADPEPEPVDNSRFHVGTEIGQSGLLRTGSSYEVDSDIRGRVPSNPEKKPGMIFDCGHPIWGYWIIRWVGKGCRERRWLLEEVLYWLDRDRPGWREVPFRDIRSVPPKLVEDVRRRLNDIDSDSEADWNPGVAAQAIVAASLEHAAIERYSEERDRRADEDQQREQLQTVRGMLQSAKDLRARASAVLALPRRMHGETSRREIRDLAATTLQLSRMLDAGDEAISQEFEVFRALVLRIVWEDGLDCIEEECRRARRLLDRSPERSEHVGTVERISLLDVAGRGVDELVPDMAPDPVEGDFPTSQLGDTAPSEGMTPEGGRVFDLRSGCELADHSSDGAGNQRPVHDSPVTVDGPEEWTGLDLGGSPPLSDGPNRAEQVRCPEWDPDDPADPTLVRLVPPDTDDHLSGDVGQVIDEQRHQGTAAESCGKSHGQHGPISEATEALFAVLRHREDLGEYQGPFLSPWGDSEFANQSVHSPLYQCFTRRRVEARLGVLSGNRGDMSPDGGQRPPEIPFEVADIHRDGLGNGRHGGESAGHAPSLEDAEGKGIDGHRGVGEVAADFVDGVLRQIDQLGRGVHGDQLGVGPRVAVRADEDVLGHSRAGGEPHEA